MPQIKSHLGAIPNCHRRENMRRYVFAIITIVLLSNISCIASNNFISTPKEPIKVNAEDLRWAYHRNEAEANAKYGGKILEVTGVIYKLGKTKSDIPWVFLTNGSENMWVGVYCDFDESAESQISLLKQWQRLTVWGRCDGRVIEDVLLKDCSLSKPLLSPSEPTLKSEPKP
jgi:hypothetical protein